MRIADGHYAERIDDAQELSRSLVAGAAPMYPPKSWFEDPALDRLTPITITADGRVFGHIADWNRDHMGLPPGVRPPRSNTDYAFFKTGALKTEEGEEVAVGNLTLAGGHAPLNASAGKAVEHYDNTASAIADINVGEDAHGIWISGGLRPGASEENIRALRASAPSGDWRPINDNLELVAVCQVNTPGFPVARTLVASGEMTALVAAGASHLYELQLERMAMASLESLETRVASLEVAVTAAAKPKKNDDSAAKSDNSSDSKGDDAVNDFKQKDANKGSDAGEPKDVKADEKKEDTTEVSNDGETESNQGKKAPQKPKLPAKKASKKPLSKSS
ncbi:head maturation protease [Gordonia phage GMA2]|uniref:Uncharacterized protein n=1 Tax=Gordonia phage GMA2 TaxID=1647283 RepID=A0A0K0N6U3_9CAUD|nr:head maturation protease [Gordonia phage GMA2]AKJ72550.1 hypothetical protein GMA2_12 [Gordonia phage GMA2]